MRQRENLLKLQQLAKIRKNCPSEWKWTFGSIFRDHVLDCRNNCRVCPVLRKFCESSVKVLWNFCESSTKVLWKFCESSVKVLWKFCVSSVKVLRKFCESSAKVLRKFCESSVKFCESSVKVIGRGCANRLLQYKQKWAKIHVNVSFTEERQAWKINYKAISVI